MTERCYSMIETPPRSRLKRPMPKSSQAFGNRPSHPLRKADSGPQESPAPLTEIFRIVALPMQSNSGSDGEGCIGRLERETAAKLSLIHRAGMNSSSSILCPRQNQKGNAAERLSFSACELQREQRRLALWQNRCLNVSQTIAVLRRVEQASHCPATRGARRAISEFG